MGFIEELILLLAKYEAEISYDYEEDKCSPGCVLSEDLLLEWYDSNGDYHHLELDPDYGITAKTLTDVKK